MSDETKVTEAQVKQEPSLPADYTPRNLGWEAALAEAFPQQPAAAAAAPPLALPGGNMQALLP